MEKISKFGSEVGVGDRLSKEEPWKKIWNLLSSERWQSGWDEQMQFMMYATHKLVCPENTMESLRRDLEEVAKRVNEEQCEKKIQRRIELELGFLVTFISMERETLDLFIERKEQKDELHLLRSQIRAQKEEQVKKVKNKKGKEKKNSRKCKKN